MLPPGLWEQPPAVGVAGFLRCHCRCSAFGGRGRSKKAARQEAPRIGGKNGGLMQADDRAEEPLSCYVLVIEKTFSEVFRKDAIIVDVYNLS